MRLLFVLPEFGPNVRGGIATYYNNLLPEFRAAGHEVTVMLADRSSAGTPMQVDDSGIRVVSLPARWQQANESRFSCFSATPALRTMLQVSQAAHDAAMELGAFDIVEATDYGLLFVPWTSDDASPPLVVQMHGSGGQIARHDP